MESIIKRAIDWWFPDGLMKAIASEILPKLGKSSGKVDSLQVQAIKSIIIQLGIEKDADQRVLFNLIFKEPVDLYEYMDRFLPQINYQISPISLDLKSDPQLFFLILEQNLVNEICNDIYIVVKREELQIVLNQFLSLKIPHPEGKEFDFGWAARFAQMVFSKGILAVSVRMDGTTKLARMISRSENYSERVRDVDSMRECLDNTLNNLNWIKPSGKWEEAINDTTRSIYMRFADSIIHDDTIFITDFAVVREYSEYFSNKYYGYIE